MPDLGIPRFPVKGVPEDREWELFNTSYYSYYYTKVEEIRSGKCPFCNLNREKNKVFLERAGWRVWENTVAPRPESKHQLLFATVRHVERVTDLSMNEWDDFRIFFQEALETDYCRDRGITDDGAFIIRSGNGMMNAKSISHMHFNFHIPSGTAKAEVTIGKSMKDLEAKIPLLTVWEKMRKIDKSLMEDNMPPLNWEKDRKNFLSPQEWELTKDKLAPAKKA